MARQSRGHFLGKGVDVIPADIDAIEFTTTRIKGGYDVDEVDDFLDRVAEAWNAERGKMEEQRLEIARLIRKLDESRSVAMGMEMTQPIPQPAPAESATRILEYAQRTADQVLADARQEADKVVNEARMEAFRAREEMEALQSKSAYVRKELLDFHRKHMNELEATGG